MSARIARGSPRGGRSKAKGGAQRKSSRKPSPPAVIEALPLPDAVRRVSWWIFIAMLIALALAVLTAFRVPQLIGSAAGEAIGRAGFAVKRVEVKGVRKMNPLRAQLVALDQVSMAMPLVDLEGTRQRLLRFGWVRDARVSRRWPDTLVIDIVERRPAAIWQHNKQLTLIDRDGVVLEPVKLEAMPDLPLVIGPAANRQASGLGRLIAVAPQLKPMMGGATWVGGRRWDIRFQSGEVLMLPEGEAAAAKAIKYFAATDQATQLLGRGFVHFDLRSYPREMRVRISREPGSRVPDVDAAPSSGNVDPSTTI